MAKSSAIIFGLIFLILGLLGLFSSPIVGPTGYFVSNSGLDIVNLLVGLILLWVGSKNAEKAPSTLKGLGVLFTVIAIIGFFVINVATNTGSILGFMTVNSAGNWLNLILGVLMFLLGLGKSSDTMPA